MILIAFCGCSLLATRVSMADVASDFSPDTRTAAAKAAEVIVRSGVRDGISTIDKGRLPELIIDVVRDALVGKIQSAYDEKGLALFSAAHESQRTDKQVGAAAAAGGSTSLVQRAGFPDLLALAIESGAVQQEERGNNLTLSTSPYALPAAVYGDTADTYKQWELLWRLGFSATAPLDRKRTTSSGTFDTNEVTAWSVRFQPIGDRSARSKHFLCAAGFGKDEDCPGRVADPNRPDIKKLMEENAGAINGAVQDLFDPTDKHHDDRLIQARADIRAVLNDRLVSLYDGKPNPTDQEVATTIENVLHDQLYLKLASNDTRNQVITPESIAHINAEIAPSLLNAAEARTRIRAELERLEAALENEDILTIEYTNQKALMGSNYSQVKGLFLHSFKNVYGIRDLEATGNLGVSFFHHPDRAMHQDTVRDYSGSFELATSFGSFPTSFSGADQTPFTLSISGEASRLEAQDAQRYTGLIKLDVPLPVGLTLPISASYVSRTEDSNKHEFRINVGTDFDFSKLLALVKAGHAVQ